MSNSQNFFVKDPDAIKDFSVDWGTNWLGSDVIATSTWIVPIGIIEESNSFDDDVATIWLSSGTSGQSYELVNRITTLGGRHDDRSILILVRPT